MPGDVRTAPRPSARPRYRYVLFRVVRPLGLDRNTLIAALRRAGGAENQAWLTRFDGSLGVLRCRRGDEAAAIGLLTKSLPATGIEVTTLSTSGTIAALERSHRDLVRTRSRH